MFKNTASKKGFSVVNEGMRRNVQIRPGQAISPKPQGTPVNVPRSWLGHVSANGAQADKTKK